MEIGHSQKTLRIKYDGDDLEQMVEKISQELSSVTIKVVENESCVYNVLIKSDSCESVDQAEAMFRSLLPTSVYFFGPDPSSPAKLEVLSEYARSHEHVAKSIKTINECFDAFDKSAVCVSFNGGKDCTVLLHLVYSVFVGRFARDQQLPALFIQMPDSFISLEAFVKQTVNRYNLKLLVYPGPDMKAALKTLREESAIEAIFMGTRSSDLPSGVTLDQFQETDKNWPKFMRVNPLMDWTYKQIWAFIRHLDLPYCSLYDHGYTSLGSPNNTKQNPRLQFQTRTGQVCYLPAYTLQDSEFERTSRTQ